MAYKEKLGEMAAFDAINANPRGKISAVSILYAALYGGRAALYNRQ